jgi:hypothetical protein
LFKNERKHKEVEEIFNVGVGWFDQFKNRVQIHNVKITGEAAIGNEDLKKKEKTVKSMLLELVLTIQMSLFCSQLI